MEDWTFQIDLPEERKHLYFFFVYTSSEARFKEVSLSDGGLRIVGTNRMVVATYVWRTLVLVSPTKIADGAVALQQIGTSMKDRDVNECGLYEVTINGTALGTHLGSRVDNSPVICPAERNEEDETDKIIRFPSC